jgi:acid phosphatase (class A)
MNHAHKTLRLSHASLVAALFFVSFIAPLRADDRMAEPTQAAATNELHYLPVGKPDAVALLAPPPLPASVEQAADMAETAAVHAQCPPVDAAAAKLEKKFFVFTFTPAIGSFFQPGKLPKTEAFLKHVQEDTESVEDTAKNFWKRPRPYTVDPALARGADDLEKSFSYPSGHSTRGTVFALVLADLFPEKTDAILAMGRDIGWHRVEIARHYPTDIYAGRVLARAIVQEMKASPKFQKDFAKAQKEIAAMSAAKTSEPLATAVH